MGSCVSKCCPKPTITKDPDLPLQDKLVISQSIATNPLPAGISITQPPTPSSSSSSSLSSKTSSCSYASTSSSMKSRVFSDNYLLSCAEKNPHIVILDPLALAKVKTAALVPARRAESPARAQLRQSSMTNATNRSLPIKRARSRSPLARQKSFRSEQGAKILVNQSISSTTTGQIKSWKMDACRGHPNIGTALAPPRIKDRLRSPSNQRKFPSWNTKDHSSGQEEARRQIHSVHHRPREGLNGKREVLFSNDQCSRVPPIEDIDNPLISMECFIFL